MPNVMLVLDGARLRHKRECAGKTERCLHKIYQNKQVSSVSEYKVNNKNQMGFLETKLVHSSNTRPGWRHRTRGKMKLHES